MLFLTAFIGGFLTDWVWTHWMKTTNQGRAFAAANWSVAVYLCSMLATYLLVEKQFIPLLFYIIGGWLGTYLAVKRHYADVI